VPSYAADAPAAEMATSLPPQPKLASEDKTWIDRLLASHNEERLRLSIPRLTWSDSLATEAREWAVSLASRQVFEHSYDRSGAGENLWMGTAGYFSAEQMIGGFVEERKHFQPGIFPQVSKTGNWADIGHYTQLIWPETRKVGCALTQNGGVDFLVCRYWPPGNVMGQRVP
jgi:hypothetical protein